MHYRSFLAILHLGWLVNHTTAETVHGVVVFSRHGDRTTKHYGSQALTALGATQNFQVGSDYRTRYLQAGSPHQILDVSEFQYINTQIYASAPDQGILVNTATAFLQGLYPPLTNLNRELATHTINNGSQSTSPLNGYQYVHLHSEDPGSPNAIWIKGDDGCPRSVAASKSFEESDEFQARLESTKEFYGSLYDAVEGVYDYQPQNMTYANAFDIFDLVNVARVHNRTSLARNVTEEELFQLRTLADSAEFGFNFNQTQPDRAIHSQTLTAALLRQLNETVVSQGRLKFSLLAGSYDTFLAFFGLANLTALSDDFYGLPDYASTMALELFTASNTTRFPADPEAALSVRWLFRNGTEGAFETFPLFGLGEDSLPWPQFAHEMQTRSIDTVEKWCDRCASPVDFCTIYREEVEGEASHGGGGLSVTVAGVIGAMVTLGVVAIVAAAVLVFKRRRQENDVVRVDEVPTTVGKSSIGGSV